MRVIVMYPNVAFLQPLAARFPDVGFSFHEDPAAGYEDALATQPDAVISMGRFMKRDLAQRFCAIPSLRWIQIASAGSDQFEGWQRPARVRVTRGAGVLDTFVAEQALALLLAVLRAIPTAVLNQQRKAWITPKAAPASIMGRRATVLGFGAIGREIASRLVAFGAEVTGVSRNPQPLAGVTTRRVEELHAVLAGTELLLMALPGGKATERMIGAAELALLAPGAVVVNVGRGSSLDQEALAAALRGGHLGGAGLDVVEPEPLPPEHPLWDAPNLLISPHVGGRDVGQPARLYALIEENMRRFVAGEGLLHLVP
jgi:phosphoglycerate dehydrogenase-like enzyme